VHTQVQINAPLELAADFQKKYGAEMPRWISLLANTTTRRRSC
jgi:hypothetical protein